MLWQRIERIFIRQKDYETGPVRRVSEVQQEQKAYEETFEEQNEYQREMFLAKEGRHYRNDWSSWCFLCCQLTIPFWILGILECIMFPKHAMLDAAVAWTMFFFLLQWHAGC